MKTGKVSKSTTSVQIMKQLLRQGIIKLKKNKPLSNRLTHQPTFTSSYSTMLENASTRNDICSRCSHIEQRCPYVEQLHATPSETYFNDRPLARATLKQSTISKYVKALKRFQLYLDNEDVSRGDCDSVIEVYINHIFNIDQRPAARQEMCNLLAMVYIVCPDVKTRLSKSTRAIAGWKHHKPSSSATPMTKDLALAFSAFFLKTNRKNAAAVVLICYGGFLRVNEALKLSWHNIALPGDARLASFPPHTAGVNIKDGKTSKKTGRLQFVLINDSTVISFLQYYRDIDPNEACFAKGLSYAAYAAALKDAVSHFCITNIAIRTHSPRIGKALDDFINGKSVEQIAISGRWKALSSLRYYLDNGRAWLLDMDIHPDNQQRLTAYAQQFTSLLI